MAMRLGDEQDDSGEMHEINVTPLLMLCWFVDYLYGWHHWQQLILKSTYPPRQRSRSRVLKNLYF